MVPVPAARDLTATAASFSRTPESCAAVCRALGEPLRGTAPPAVRGWLLIEHPGPWPAFGLPEDLPKPVVDYARTAQEYGVRTQLIRRTDRTGRSAATPRLLISGGTGGLRWLEGRTFYEPRALWELDPAAFARPEPPGFGAPADAAFLVCTHGRREMCCAVFGRPVARALADRFGPLVWETTHVGGDRFAASLVVLPAGVYYGRLDAVAASRAAELALRGELDLETLRGTAGLPGAAQAAEGFLRRALGLTGLAAVRFLDRTGPAVRFAVGPDVYTVTLEERDSTRPRLTSCGQGTIERPTRYRLTGITCCAPRPGPAAR